VQHLPSSFEAAKPRYMKPPTGGERSHRGFTLLEVMVALAILATAFAAALRLHSDSMGMLISSRIHTKAAELAQYKMTEIELTGWMNLGLPAGEFGELEPDYVWDVRVESTPSVLFKKVTVAVRNRHGGKSGEFELSEYMLDEVVAASFEKIDKKETGDSRR
jgi:general secretion pathway protein I